MTKTRPFVSLFGIDMEADIVKIAVAAVRQGYAVIPIRPASKSPLCTLTDKERRAVGDHPCGVKHAIVQEAEARRVFARLSSVELQPVNIAVVAHPSRLIVVDADTSEAVRAFADLAGGMTPTCRTPGALDQSGEWRHQGGGHFYFGVPDGVELDATPGVLTRDGYDIRWGMSYTLVPPSTRPEGHYEPTGEVLPAPPWLVEAIQEHIQQSREPSQGGDLDYLDWDDPIAVWSRAHPWEELLTDDGWSVAPGRDGRCGCPVFTRPGGGSTSPRSAVGHDNDCLAYQNAEGHGPLHLWTTDPPEPLKGMGATMTKLSYYAAMHHGGDEAAACVHLGLRADLMQWVDQVAGSRGGPAPEAGPARDTGVATDGADHDHDHAPDKGGHAVAVVDVREPAAVSGQQDLRQPAHAGVARGERFWQRHPNIPEEVRTDVKRRAADIALAKLAAQYSELMLSDRPPAYTLRGGSDLAERLASSGPEDLPTVGHRSDGRGLLYAGRISVVAGRPGAGKSWLTLHIAQQCLAEGKKVVLLDFEDSNHLTAQRLRAIGVDVGAVVRAGLLHLADIDGVMTREDLIDLLAEVERLEPVYVGLDSANAMITMFGDITDNTTVTWVYRELWRSAMKGGYAMLIVDHVPNNRAKRAIGAQAKQAALTGTFFMLESRRPFAEGKEGESLLSFQEKDRPGGIAVYADDKSRVGLLRLGPDISDEGTFGTVARLEPIPDDYDSDEKESDPILDCAAAVMHKLREHGGEATRNQIRDGVSSKLKKHLDKALKYLKDDGLIETFSEGRRSMIRTLET